MRNICLIFVLIYLVFPSISVGQTQWSYNTLSDRERLMDIGIYRDIKVSQFRISWAEKGYLISGDSLEIGEMYEGDVYTFKKVGQKVKILKNNVSLGVFDTVSVKPNNPLSEFKIKTLIPSYRERQYYGGLLITSENTQYFKIINQVPLDFYLAGVIESESGSRQNKEYYKVQAIISRTYALKNINKHKKEGFMLTDLVNCQVYKNKCRYNPIIYDAVRESDGLVIVDSTLSLITASFYSNSGGQTANSEDVWNTKLDYLRSIKDPYSEGRLNHRWTKSIPRMKWLTYLSEKFQYPITDSLARMAALSFKQYQRKAFFVHPSYGVPLRDIRKDWRLKSTFFSVKVSGDQVVFTGKGFGHGVGLSQEGAMTMSKKGFSFTEIIKFYYTNIELIGFNLMEFYLMEYAHYKD